MFSTIQHNLASKLVNIPCGKRVGECEDRSDIPRSSIQIMNKLTFLTKINYSFLMRFKTKVMFDELHENNKDTWRSAPAIQHVLISSKGFP